MSKMLTSMKNALDVDILSFSKDTLDVLDVFVREECSMYERCLCP